MALTLSGTNGVVGAGFTLDPSGASVTAGVGTFSSAKVGAAVTITESGIEASGIGITCANINGAQIGGRRNMVINGAMNVAQRTTSSSGSSTTLTYICDRFFVYADNIDNLVLTRAQVSDAPAGFSKSFKVSVTTAETTLDANEALQVGQRIEAQDLQHLENGSSTAKPVTLSFFVKSYQTGTFNVNLYKPDNTVRHISATYTVNQSATWEKKTITFAGDTAGGGINDDNGNGLTLYWHLAAGSNYTSADSTSWGNYSAAGFAYGQAVNVMSSTDNYWQITGVQLEVGSQATPFEHRSFGEELQLCQRYYQKSYDYSVTPGTATNTGAIINTAYAAINYAGFSVQLPVRMRDQPTVTLYSTSTGATGKMNADSAVGTAQASYIGEKNFFANRQDDSTGVGANVYMRCHYQAVSEL